MSTKAKSPSEWEEIIGILFDSGQELPGTILPSCKEKFSFSCVFCGNKYSYRFDHLVRLRKTTCGRCNMVKRGDVVGARFGSLSLVEPAIPEQFTSDGTLLLFHCERGHWQRNKLDNVKKNPVCSQCALSDKEAIAFFEEKPTRKNTTNDVPTITAEAHEILRRRAESAGLFFFDDEYRMKPTMVENFIRQRLGKNKPLINLRPSQCGVKIVDSDTVTPLYETFHYIGSCRAKWNIGVFFQEKLIAAMSLASPTRQNIEGIEIVRMCGDNEHHVHGLWSFLVRWANKELGVKHFVTFSDNRLSDGLVYKKIGFTKTRDVDKDYYWVKGDERRHKSGMRKTDEERLTGKTETQLREEQGYHRVWDLGKKKWELIFK